jgi:hypothetical protein
LNRIAVTAVFAAALSAALLGRDPAGAQPVPPSPIPSMVPSPAPAASPKAAASPAASGSPAASASPVPTPSPTPFKPITYNGYGDLGFTSMNGGPYLQNGSQITTRIFDRYQNVPDPQAINLTANINTPIGGKVEIIAGTDANIIASTGQSTTSGFNLVQAYAQAAKGPFTIFLGKFETLAGAEVIESNSSSDYNYSRSYQFGLGEPFTHTGARVTYAQPSGKYTISGGVNEGWDNWEFVGQGPTFELSGSVNISPVLSLTATTYNGREFTFSPAGPPIVRGNRMLYDFLGTFKPGPWSFVFCYDTAVQLETPYGLLPDNAPNAKWNSLAGYIRYQISPIFYVASRGESFNDVNGYRTQVFGFSTVSSPNQILNEGTLTFGYTPNSNYIFRAEVRKDNDQGPNIPQFAGLPLKNGGFRSSETSFGLEAIAQFP